MDENILRLRVGIFVVIAMCILGILIFLNSEGWVQQYTVFIKPSSAPGVTVGTPIRKNGILIGRVKRVEPDDAKGYVILELGINQSSLLFENEVCSIGSDSLLGDAAIEFLALPMDQRGEQVRDRQTLDEVAIRRDPFKMIVDLQPQLNQTLIGVQDAAQSVQEAGSGINDLSDTIQNAFQDEGSEFKELLKELRQMSVKAQTALDNFNRIFENVNNVVGDPAFKGQIKQALAELPKIFQEVRVAIADTREAVNKFGTIPEGVNATVADIQELTAKLKQQAPDVLAQINSSLKNADGLINEVRRFTKNLDEIDFENSSVGKLFNDQELYNSIQQTIRNIEETSTKLEPMANDLRIFADKIARSPGSLVRGAIGPKGQTDYKGTAGRDGGVLNGGRYR